MQLTEKSIESEKENWERAGYRLPAFHVAEVRKRTEEAPFWIHFGAGNIFRAFQAQVVQTLLDEGVLDRGLIVAEGFDYELIDRLYNPHDNYSILATLRSDGSVGKTVIASVMEARKLDSAQPEEFKRLRQIFSASSLQMASFTITEKGYSLTNASGLLLPDVERDLRKGPQKPESYLGKVASMLYTRYQNGKKPIAMVSMDNCSHNGEKLCQALLAFAVGWTENGLTEPGFLSYINDPAFVSFPWTMIDKITPRPDRSVCALLAQDGVEGIEPIVTSRHTYAAPFVNAEECQYLVIEDAFPAGRPALEKAGLLFTDRETVEKVEKMKVCTCLNPLHTCLAVFGCLLGFQKISDEMKDPLLLKLVNRLGYEEGLPVVVHPGVLNPEKFIGQVIKDRLPNPFIPDTPQRIATDTSQKLAIRFGETVKTYMAQAPDKAAGLAVIPLVFAGWLRYLMGVDDAGNPFEPSPDPLLEELAPYTAALRLGRDAEEALLSPLLHNAGIWGVDLYEASLAKAVLRDLNAMLAGPGAVRAVLTQTAGL